MTIELARHAPSDEPRALRRRTARGFGALALVATVGFAVGACGDDDNRYASTGGVVDGSSNGVDVSDAWARSSPAGVTIGAAYMTIESAAGDHLVGAAVPADVAATVAFHETVAAEGQDSAATQGTGAAMTMRQVSSVALPSGEAVAFEPGGLHMMLNDLAGPLEPGSSFELTLTFATAAPRTVTVDVRDEAP